MKDALITLEEFLESEIGIQGRLITGSKSGYHTVYPKNMAVFNSNMIAIMNGEPKKIWHGDVDLTLESQKILNVSKHLGCPICILYEMDARFENAENPLIENRIAIFDAASTPSVVLGNKYKQYLSLAYSNETGEPKIFLKN